MKRVYQFILSNMLVCKKKIKQCKESKKNLIFNVTYRDYVTEITFHDYAHDYYHIQNLFTATLIKKWINKVKRSITRTHE